MFPPSMHLMLECCPVMHTYFLSFFSFLIKIFKKLSLWSVGRGEYAWGSGDRYVILPVFYLLTHICTHKYTREISLSVVKIPNTCSCEVHYKKYGNGTWLSFYIEFIWTYIVWEFEFLNNWYTNLMPPCSTFCEAWLMLNAKQTKTIFPCIP